ncbi:hypothetical protein AOA61_28055, partial [Pseudomonas sp. 2995-1]
GALLIAIFVPNKLKKAVIYQEIAKGSTINKNLFNIWYFLVKYIIPFAIIFVFLYVLGVFNIF